MLLAVDGPTPKLPCQVFSRIGLEYMDLAGVEWAGRGVVRVVVRVVALLLCWICCSGLRLADACCVMYM